MKMHNINNCSKRHRGFTILELMMGVAIIGILAAVAIPTYSNYLNRSKLSEPVGLMSGMKVPVEEWCASNSCFETYPSPVSLEAKSLGKYTDNIAYKGNECVLKKSDGTEVIIKPCVIVLASFKEELGNRVLVYDPVKSDWRCTVRHWSPNFSLDVYQKPEK